MNSFIKELLGNASTAQLFAGLFYAYLTAFAMLMYRTTKRDVTSDNTPVQFNWSFFWKDNKRRIIANAILIILALRFSTAWISPEWSVYSACAIGLLSDKLGWLFELVSDKLSQNAKSKIDKIS